MKYGKISEVTGKTVKGWYEWLWKHGMGCSSLCFGADAKYNYAVVAGWHKADEGWALAWKIGRQTVNNCMQCEFDVDFEMPYSEESGEVDDTLTYVETADPSLMSMKEWNSIASEMRREARRVWKAWKSEAEG